MGKSPYSRELFQDDRISSIKWGKRIKWGKSLIQEIQREEKEFPIMEKLRSPEGWKEVRIIFKITSHVNQFPCNLIYYLEKQVIGTYQGLINIGELEFHNFGIPEKEVYQLILGLEFLKNHKSWKHLEK